MEDQAKNTHFQDFLEKFAKEHPEQESLPIRFITYYLTEEEAEGECLDFATEYLKSNHCPDGLTEVIARQTVDAILKTDLSVYIAPETPSVDDGPLFDDDSATQNSENDEPVKQAPPRLEAARLARAVFNQVHEVCSSLKGSPPAMSKPDVYYCAHAVKNTRRKMEDKHVTLTHFNTLYPHLQNQPSQYYFAVFDGHGGVEAAHYAGIHLHNNLAHSEHLLKDPSKALADSFEKTDTDFVAKSRREILKCGSTGVSIILRKDKFHLAWLGDSQALLVKAGKAVTIMDAHKPEREDEKARIEELGGCVVWFGAWRVNGSLSVSRAIGDTEHKPFVSGTPDVNTIALEGDEDYIVLACDGLWDTVEPHQVVRIVYDTLQEEKGDRQYVAHKLVQAARDSGSTDNITVIVVFLREKISEPQPQEMFNISEGQVASNESSTDSEDTKSPDSSPGGKDNSPPRGKDNTDLVNSQSSTDSGVLDLSQPSQGDTC